MKRITPGTHSKRPHTPHHTVLLDRMKLSPHPTKEEAEVAAEAAKTLRVLVAKETDDICKVTDYRWGDEDDAPEDGVDQGVDSHERRDPFNPDVSLSDLQRTIFIALGRHSAVRDVLVPMLRKHGEQHRPILQRYLSLLCVLCAPVITKTKDYRAQEDVLRKNRAALMTDAFFGFLVAAATPLVTKRVTEPLLSGDAALLNTILTIIQHSLRGQGNECDAAVGALCRSHAVEMFHVLLHQNYAKLEAIERLKNGEWFEDQKQEGSDHGVAADEEQQPLDGATTEPTATEEGMSFPVADGALTSGTVDASNLDTQLEVLPPVDSPVKVVPEAIEKEDDDGDGAEKETQSPARNDSGSTQPADEEDEEDSGWGTSSESSLDDEALKKAMAKDLVLARMVAQHEDQLKEESAHQVEQWNDLLLGLLTSLYGKGDMSDVASLVNNNSAKDLLYNRLNNQGVITSLMQEKQRLTQVSRMTRPVVAGTGLLVRRGATKDDATLITTTSSLMSESQKGYLQQLDKNKRERFRRNKLVPKPELHALPLPVQIQLSKQFHNFVLSGYYKMSTMLWRRVEKQTMSFNEALQAGEIFIGEHDLRKHNSQEHGDMSMAMSYFRMSSLVLQYAREYIALNKAKVLKEKAARAAAKAAAMQCVDAELLGMTPPRSASLAFTDETEEVGADVDHPLLLQFAHILTESQFHVGFTAVVSLLQVRRLNEATAAINFVKDQFATLRLLLTEATDPTVKLAAQTLAANVLFDELRVDYIFNTTGQAGGKARTPYSHLQQLVQLLAELIHVMEAVAPNGVLYMPKKQRGRGDDVGVDDQGKRKRMRGDGSESEGSSDSERDAALDEEDRAAFIAEDEEEVAKRERKQRRRQKRKATLEAKQQQEAAEDDLLIGEDGGQQDTAAAAAGAVTQEIIEETALMEIVDTQEDGGRDGGQDDDVRRRPSESGSQGRQSEDRRSFGSSNRTGLSSIPELHRTAREVSITSYLHKLQSKRHMTGILALLQRWRSNSKPTNAAVTFIMQRWIDIDAYHSLFNIEFFLCFSDLLHNGVAGVHDDLVAVARFIIRQFFTIHQEPSEVAMAACRALFCTNYTQWCSDDRVNEEAAGEVGDQDDEARQEQVEAFFKEAHAKANADKERETRATKRRSRKLEMMMDPEAAPVAEGVGSTASQGVSQTDELDLSTVNYAKSAQGKMKKSRKSRAQAKRVDDVDNVNEAEAKRPRRKRGRATGGKNKGEEPDTEPRAARRQQRRLLGNKNKDDDLGLTQAGAKDAESDAEEDGAFAASWKAYKAKKKAELSKEEYKKWKKSEAKKERKVVRMLAEDEAATQASQIGGAAAVAGGSSLEFGATQEVTAAPTQEVVADDNAGHDSADDALLGLRASQVEVPLTAEL